MEVRETRATCGLLDISGFVIFASEAFEARHERTDLVRQYSGIVKFKGAGNHDSCGKGWSVLSTLQHPDILFAITASFGHLSLLQVKFSATLHNNAGESSSNNWVVPVRLLNFFWTALRHKRADNERLQSIVPGSILSIRRRFLPSACVEAGQDGSLTGSRGAACDCQEGDSQRGELDLRQLC
jgi:hypothetical protein